MIPSLLRHERRYGIPSLKGILLLFSSQDTCQTFVFGILMMLFNFILIVLMMIHILALLPFQSVFHAWRAFGTPVNWVKCIFCSTLRDPADQIDENRSDPKIFEKLREPAKLSFHITQMTKSHNNTINHHPGLRSQFETNQRSQFISNRWQGFALGRLCDFQCFNGGMCLVKRVFQATWMCVLWAIWRNVNTHTSLVPHWKCFEDNFQMWGQLSVPRMMAPLTVHVDGSDSISGHKWGGPLNFVVGLYGSSARLDFGRNIVLLIRLCYG